MSAVISSTPAETFSPHPSTWATLARSAFHGRGGDDAGRAKIRNDLGLPADRVVIMSGHQAEFWHPGIAAKFFAMHALVRTLNSSGVPAAAAWIIVDQDDNDPTQVRFPALRRGVLTTGVWSMSPETLRLAGVPTGAKGPISPTAPPEFRGDAGGDVACPASPMIARGLSAMHASLGAGLGAADGAATLAEQFTRAAAGMLMPLMEKAGISQPTHFVSATALARGLLPVAAEAHAMSRRPGACIAAYNAGAAEFPEAGIRPLVVDASRPRHELPLWRVRRGEPRMPVFAEQLNPDGGAAEFRADAGTLGRIPREELVPRALFMTSLLRGYACDLFLHGLGGGVYDKVMEAWIRGWKSPEAAAGLAPGVVASATRLIPQPGRELVTNERAARAAWLAHRAAHDPAAIADEAAAARKREWLAKIGALREKPERLAAYRAMHADLAAFRAAHAEELTSLSRGAADARARAAESGVMMDRTWAFALHDETTLAGLRDAVIAAIAGGPAA